MSINLDTAVLDRYAGDYQLSPTAVLTVTRAGTQMFAQLTGQPKAEIFAQSESEFFYRIVKARISFETDSQGRTHGSGAPSKWPEHANATHRRHGR